MSGDRDMLVSNKINLISLSVKRSKIEPFYDSKLLESFENYLKETKNKFIVLKKKDDSESVDVNKCYIHRDKNGYEYRLIPYIIRFSERYVKDLKKRFSKLNSALNLLGKNWVFGTLTCNPSKRSATDSLEQINRAWHKFHEVLKRRYLKNTGKKELMFIKVLEPQQTNFVHIHYILFDCKVSDIVTDFEYREVYNNKRGCVIKKGVSKELESFWVKYGFGYVNQFEPVKADSHVLNKAFRYILKYIGKGIKNKMFSAMLWATRTRSYSCSSSISKIIKKDRCDIDRGWEYIGVVSLTDLLEAIKNNVSLVEIVEFAKSREYWLEYWNNDSG